MKSVTENRLRIFDFDDTLAETGEKVKLYTNNGDNFRMQSSDEFATYQLKRGEYYDESSFYQFDDVNVDAAQPVLPVVDILKNSLNAPGTRKILILTARNQNAETGIRNFLQSIGVDDTNIDVVGVGDKRPVAKVKVIHDYLTNILDNVRFVSFFDDSGPNVQAVSQYLRQSGVKHDVAQVETDKTGQVRLNRKISKKRK
tara:strand:+ start:5964 stop:6563 length:600 start_codon:yes stop_codon:yes gene_type:complete